MTDYVATIKQVLVPLTNGQTVIVPRGYQLPAEALPATVTHLLAIGAIEAGEGASIGGVQPDLDGEGNPIGPPASPTPPPYVKTVSGMAPDVTGNVDAGGSAQIAAKPTDETPAISGSSAGPGLYADTSEAVTDGGWSKVDIADDHVDLTLGLRDSDAGSILRLSEDAGGGTTASLLLHADGDEFQSSISAYADAGAALGDAQATLVLSDYGNAGDPGIVLTYQKQFGPTLGVNAGPDHVAPLMTLGIGSPVYRPIMWVDTTSMVLFSPNGSGHRVRVADDGTLSTEPL
jgi:hypothetical protein